MFGWKTKKKKLKIEKEERLKEIDEVSEVQYFAINKLEELEDIIVQNKLKLEFEKIIYCINDIKFCFNFTNNVDVDGKVEFSNVKTILGYEKDFQRISNNIKLDVDCGMMRFSVKKPDSLRDKVLFEDVYLDLEEIGYFENFKIPTIIGVNEANEILCYDLSKLPHIIVGGATGSGKSNCVNSMICGWLKTMSPSKLQLALIDPKNGLELDYYSGLNEYLFDNIAILGSDSINLIKKVGEELERRMKYMKEYDGVKKIDELHELGIELPYLVLVIDEMANVTNAAKNKDDKNEFDSLMEKLLQLGRAMGILVIMATQRPEVKVITGAIKANVPFRVGFFVPSAIDSKTIIDRGGLEELYGLGDGIVFEGGVLTRFQSPFISNNEIKKIVNSAFDKYCKKEEIIEGNYDI